MDPDPRKEIEVDTDPAKCSRSGWIRNAAFNLAQKRFFQPVNSQKPRRYWSTCRPLEHVPEIRLQHPNAWTDCQNVKGTFVTNLKTDKKCFFFFSKKLYPLKGLIVVKFSAKLHQFSVLGQSVP